MKDLKESLILPTGLVVLSKCGRDKGDFLIILKQIDEDYVLLVDGKRRPVERPKKKKIKHLQKTNTILDVNDESSNKRVRRVLREYLNPKEDY